MAQAITNTVPKDSYGGLFTPPKKNYGGLLGGGLMAAPMANSTPQTTSMTAKPLFPSTQTQSSVIQPMNAPQAAPVAKPAVQTATPAPLAAANTTPIVGGTGSGGTLNPNFTMQTGSAQAGGSTPVRGLFSDVATSLAAKSRETNPMTEESFKRAQQLAETLKQSRLNQARAESNQLLAPIPIGDATGRQQVTRSQYLAEQSALTGQLQAEQALAGLGITQQQAQQSALSSAGSLAQPSVAAYGQTVFDPTSGGFTGGGSLPPEVMQQYAQMAATGQYAAIPSFITGNPVLNAQLNVAAKAINPSYTPVGSQGASQVLGTIPALQSAEAAADGIKNTIITYLQTNPQINASNLSAAGVFQQWLAGQTSDPKYQTFLNYLNEYTNTLAPILGVGGDTTNLKTQIAQGFINAAASGQSIAQVLNATSALAKNKVIDLQAGATGGGTSVPDTSNQTPSGSVGWY